MGKVILQYNDQHTSDSMTAALQEEGYNVLSLSSPSHIFSQIDSFKPQAILLEFIGNTSIETCRMIKARYPHIPVIALSCNHLIACEYSQHGFNGYVVKPFDINQLYAIVEIFIPGRLATAS